MQSRQCSAHTPQVIVLADSELLPAPEVLPAMYGPVLLHVIVERGGGQGL